MKNKIISIRVDEETYNRLKKSKIDVNEAIRKELSKIAGMDKCPICGQPANAKKFIDV